MLLSFGSPYMFFFFLKCCLHMVLVHKIIQANLWQVEKRQRRKIYSNIKVKARGFQPCLPKYSEVMFPGPFFLFCPKYASFLDDTSPIKEGIWEDKVPHSLDKFTKFFKSFQIFIVIRVPGSRGACKENSWKPLRLFDLQSEHRVSLQILSLNPFTEMLKIRMFSVLNEL